MSTQPSFVAPAPDSKRRRVPLPPWTTERARTVLVAALVVGVACDQALRTSPIGLAGTVAVWVVAGALVAAKSVTGIGRAFVASAAALAPWLTLRTSPWLVGPDLLATAVLLVLGAACRSSGPPTFLALAERGLSVFAAGWDLPGEGQRLVKEALPSDSSTSRAAVARGTLVAMVIALVLLALLTGGDRFFASLVGIGTIGARVLDVVVIGAAAAAWFTLVVGHRQGRGDTAVKWPTVKFGAVEATIVLGACTAVLASYVGSLVWALLQPDYVRRRTGLTYAEYARSGFFQLIAVAAIVAMIVLVLRPIAATARRPLVPLGLAAAMVALTLAMVVVSVARLQTYRSVFGLTMLRFATTVFAVWVGLVLVLIGISIFWTRLRPLLVTAVLFSAFGTLTATNWSNPEAIVARENIERGDGSSSPIERSALDGEYLGTALSDDAVPALLSRAGRLTPEERQSLLTDVCLAPDPSRGWSWNRAHAQAAKARRTYCGDVRP